MKKYWRKVADQIDALSLRERAMVFGAVVVVVVYVMSALLIDPLASRSRALSARMTQQQLEMKAIAQRIQALEQKRADPDAAALARRDGIQRQIAEIDASLRSLQQSLVPAQNMKVVLQELLARNPRLQLIALRTLPVSPLVEKRGKTEKPDAAGPTPAAGEGSVFKHGVRITIQGGYADLHDYLARLERQAWRMFWSRASLAADDYPRLTLTVTLYTLSLDKAWLVV